MSLASQLAFATTFPARHPRVTRLKRALSACTDRQLLALIDATAKAPQVDPKLVAWFEAALLWEWDRRTGCDYRLKLPEADASVVAVQTMRKAFAHRARAAHAVVDAAIELLSDRMERLH